MPDSGVNPVVLGRQIMALVDAAHRDRLDELHDAAWLMAGNQQEAFIALVWLVGLCVPQIEERVERAEIGWDDLLGYLARESGAAIRRMIESNEE